MYVYVHAYVHLRQGMTNIIGLYRVSDNFILYFRILFHTSFSTRTVIQTYVQLSTVKDIPIVEIQDNLNFT
jgi:hypothetical protein